MGIQWHTARGGGVRARCVVRVGSLLAALGMGAGVFAAEVFVSPKVGQVGAHPWGKEPAPRTDVLLYTPTLGLAVGVIAHNGFAFTTELDAGLAFLMFRAQFLVGWAIRSGKNFAFIPSLGVDILSTQDDKLVGIPINLDFLIFFTKHVGLDFTFGSGVNVPLTKNLKKGANGNGQDLTWSNIWAKYCCTSLVMVKIGPVFRI
ncbi:DUF2715 domain-containing protein [Treponema pallidum]|nr:DUF2715 domain-containing protein [Treponema pallidum]QUK15576.2 DUF2715 domain-containing protein [Treponema pallidum]UXI56107.1 DUF2715 domain-containing protein [Treponema pallidum]